MGIWNRLINKTITPVVADSIKQLTANEMMEDDNFVLNKIKSMRPDLYLTQASGGNLRQYPDSRFSPDTLRDLSVNYPILRACINYRKREMTKLEWAVVPEETSKTVEEREKVKKDIRAVNDFLKFPTGDRSVSFRHFLNQLIEDLLVLDAVAIYRRKNRKQGIYGYLPIDGGTIDLVLNEDGTTPQPPQVAYIQTIDGQDTAKLTTDELIYRMMNPRTYTPYGLSPVETLVMTITTALKLSTYNLGYLSEGNVPEGFVELPKDVASNPDQLQLWQEAWDAMMSGNVNKQRKIKFLPEGMKWHPIKKQEEMEFKRFEEWLLLNTCSIMEVPPQAIGFQFERGKGATEAEWEIGKERSAFPTANFIREIMDEIIKYDLNQSHLKFNWTNINPTNRKEEAEVFGQMARLGGVSVDEWRIAEGFEPIGLGQYIMTPVGPIMVKDFVKLSEAGQNPFIPPRPDYADSSPPGFDNPTNEVKPKEGEIAGNPEDTEVAGNPEDTEVEAPKEEVISQPQKMMGVSLQTNKEIRKEAIKDLKNWRKVATKDIASGKEPREFYSKSIDNRTKEVIKDGLKVARSKVEVYNLFDPFISREGEVLSAVLDLYDEINLIISAGQVESDSN